MELERKDIPARTYLQGNQKVSLAEKGKIRVQTKSHGEEWVDLIEETIPNGKAWDVSLTMYVEEV